MLDTQRLPEREAGDDTPASQTAGQPRRRADQLARLGALTPDELVSIERDEALRIEHVSKRFVKTEGMWLPWKKANGARKRQRIVRAVSDVSLTVRRRQIYGVLGSNGSGKSTLIRLISTLLLPDEGRLEVFGYDVVRDAPVVRKLINRVSVEAAFFRKLSPMENLLYSARLYGVPAAQARHDIRAVLERLGIRPDRVSQPLEHMSRGMQQKVAIARAFLTAPVLLLLDEPTTGLDPRSKLDVQRFVAELRDTHDATILLTTHDMDEADALCDRIAVIDGGRIVADGEPDELKAAVRERLGLDHPATLTEVFMAYTGRDWEAEEAEEDDDEPNEAHDANGEER
ncbi:MAG TPA: ABC transporter ATP-binding protein, partial [Ktedonobacterales bacterium]|jgi:ABC-2 type transport system ATP-binding protein